MYTFALAPSLRRFCVLHIRVFSIFALYLLGAGFVLSGIAFHAGLSLRENYLLLLTIVLLAGALTVVSAARMGESNLRSIGSSLIISLAATIVLTFICLRVYDKSWDGMAYHQITILKLYEGWNPVTEVVPETKVESKYYSHLVSLNSYVNHYPKAHETLATLFFVSTGKLESGKVINVLFVIASFGFAYEVLRRIRLSVSWSLLLAAAAALNPIAMNQIFSFYVDGAAGSLLLILICQLTLMYIKRADDDWTPFLNLFLVIVLLCNLKFTTLVYTVLFLMMFLLFLLIYRENRLLKRFILTGATSGVMAVFVLGFNPYVRNTRDFGHPFHPVAGKYKRDIISSHRPAQLASSNWVVKFLSSTFSESANFDSRKSNRRIRYKVPFTFGIAEMKAFQSEGVRLGGFGVLWSGIFLFSLLAVPVAIYLSAAHKYLVVSAILAILISVVVNPEAWWARFIPQLWILPVVLTCVLLRYGRGFVLRASQAIVIILILNSLLVGAVAFSSTLHNTKSINREFARFRNLDAPVKVYFDIFTPNERKLLEARIPYVRVNRFSDLDCSNPETVSKFDYCLP